MTFHQLALTLPQTIDLLLSLQDRVADSLLVVAVDEHERPIPSAATLISDIPWDCAPAQRAIAFAWLSRLGHERVVVAFGHDMPNDDLDRVWARSARDALALFGMQVVAAYSATRAGVTPVAWEERRAA